MSKPFIDLHIHLIPKVDDGPGSMEATLELGRYLADDGVTRVVVTPHFNSANPGRLSSQLETERELELVRHAFGEAGLDLELLAGAEHFLTPDVAERALSGQVPLLGPGPYILVELPFRGEFPRLVLPVLRSLVQGGLTPVLAHPERYSWTQDDPAEALALADEGVVLQCTAGSLGGQYGDCVRKTAQHLLLEGGYQLVGSDLHRAGQPRLLSVMEQTVTKIAGEHVASLLFHDNPARVLQSERLLTVPPIATPPVQKRLFGMFSR